MLEVCIDSLESAINAIHGGADELEVCSSLAEGGLTPSAGLVKQILSAVNNIPSSDRFIYKSCPDYPNTKQIPKVNIMIRCRTGSDFVYSEQEMDTMMADIEVFKEMGVDRFVFGSLTDSFDINEDNCSRIVMKAYPTPITFHRAFDMCKDPLIAMEKIINLGFDRVLTSGQRSTAAHEDALKFIRNLVNLYGDKIQIMPGAGVTADNAKLFIELGCNIVHSSCKRIRYLPKIESNIKMGTSESEYIFITDKDIVMKLKEVLSK